MKPLRLCCHLNICWAACGVRSFDGSSSLIVAKETAKVVEIITEDDPNPEKKKKILENKKKKQNKAKDFYCSKVNDEEKCGN